MIKLNALIKYNIIILFTISNIFNKTTISFKFILFRFKNIYF